MDVMVSAFQRWSYGMRPAGLGDNILPPYDEAVDSMGYSFLTHTMSFSTVRCSKCIDEGRKRQRKCNTQCF
jgi:hypothetical protein